MLLSISSTMGIFMDVAIVAILVIFGLVGFKKGFFKSIISMLSTIVVLVISFFGASYLARLINKIYDFTGLIARKLCGGIAGMGEFYSVPITSGESGAELAAKIPSGTNGFLKKLMSYVLKPLSAADVEGATVAEIVSGSFASVIMLIISGILLFIALKIIIGLVTRLFDNITRNRVFGAANKLLGLAFGAAKGLLIIIVFAFALTILTVIPKVNTKLTPVIQDHSHIARPIYNYTDEMVEKYVIDGEIVQKWIDNLWENKYKGRGDSTPEPQGSLANPYVVELSENAGVYTKTFNINFGSGDEMYYKFTPNSALNEQVTLTVNGSDTAYKLTTASDTATEITNLTTLEKSQSYIIKFIKGTLSQVEITITLSNT